MKTHVLTFSGEAHGEMLRGELCNRVWVSFTARYNKPEIAALSRGTMAHIHEHVNHLGYSPILGADFVIVHLN